MKTLTRKNTLFLAIFFLFSLLLPTCQTTQKTDAEYFVVDVLGEDRDDAILESKKKILEKGLGVLVEGQSSVIDGESQYKEVFESVEGYVFDYQILKEGKKDFLYGVKAKGKVNKKALKDALENRLKEIGKPRFMVLIDEDFLGAMRSPGESLTEKEMVSRFKDFEFIDRDQMQKVLAKESGGLKGSYENPDKALKIAAELAADFLFIGKTKIVKGGEIMGSGMYSIQSTLEYKIIDVVTAGITAADASKGAYPHISAEQGAQGALKRAFDTSAPNILQQVQNKWKAGRTIRVVIEGIDYDTFLDKNIRSEIRKLRNVNEVVLRSSNNSNNSVELEVKAMCSAFELYDRMRQGRQKLGINFAKKEITGGVVRIVVQP
jgi:hypothetical protein